MTDPWRTIAIVSLFIGAASALIIAVDLVAGHKQRMWIMNWVWPITALYAGPLGLWGYSTTGRLSTYRVVQEAKARGEEPPGRKNRSGKWSRWVPHTAAPVAPLVTFWRNADWPSFR
jgi:hypothetical protein